MEPAEAASGPQSASQSGRHHTPFVVIFNKIVVYFAQRVWYHSINTHRKRVIPVGKKAAASCSTRKPKV